MRQMRVLEYDKSCFDSQPSYVRVPISDSPPQIRCSNRMSSDANRMLNAAIYRANRTGFYEDVRRSYIVCTDGMGARRKH